MWPTKEKTMKTLYSLVVLLCLSLVATESLADETESGEGERHLEYSIGFTVDHYGDYQVSAVPELVRAVPLHVDDGYLSGLSLAREPIVDDEAGSLDRQSAGFSFLASYRNWLELGARVGFVEMKSQYRVQQNQFGGTERGSAASLRYYELETESTASFFLVGGISFPIVKKKENGWGGMRLALGGEYDLFGTKLGFVAGWDRFNSDETWQHLNGGRLFQDGVYARLDFAVGDSGWVFLQVNRSEVRLEIEAGFEDMVVEAPDLPIFLGFRINISDLL